MLGKRATNAGMKISHVFSSRGEMEIRFLFFLLQYLRKVTRTWIKFVGSFISGQYRMSCTQESFLKFSCQHEFMGTTFSIGQNGLSTMILQPTNDGKLLHLINHLSATLGLLTKHFVPYLWETLEIRIQKKISRIFLETRSVLVKRIPTDGGFIRNRHKDVITLTDF